MRKSKQSGRDRSDTSAPRTVAPPHAQSNVGPRITDDLPATIRVPERESEAIENFLADLVDEVLDINHPAQPLRDGDPPTD